MDSPGERGPLDTPADDATAADPLGLVGFPQPSREERSVGPDLPQQPVPKLKIGDLDEHHTILDLLAEVVNRGASDLHLTAGAPPHLRIDGELQPMDLPVYQPSDLKGLVFSMMHEKQIKTFETEREFDFAYSLKNVALSSSRLFSLLHHTWPDLPGAIAWLTGEIAGLLEHLRFHRDVWSLFFIERWEGWRAGRL